MSQALRITVATTRVEVGLVLRHGDCPLHDGYKTVHVENLKSFEAWNHPHKCKGFQDLSQDLKVDKSYAGGSRAMACCLKGQYGGRCNDAHKATNERVEELEGKLQAQDARGEKIDTEASRCIQMLLEDQSHFCHQKQETGN